MIQSHKNIDRAVDCLNSGSMLSSDNELRLQGLAHNGGIIRNRNKYYIRP